MNTLPQRPIAAMSLVVRMSQGHAASVPQSLVITLENVDRIVSSLELDEYEAPIDADDKPAIPEWNRG